MKGSRRVLFSLMVALLALSALAPQVFVSFDDSVGSGTEGNYHTGSFLGG